MRGIVLEADGNKALILKTDVSIGWFLSHQSLKVGHEVHFIGADPWESDLGADPVRRSLPAYGDGNRPVSWIRVNGDYQ
jgi:hypothetical protein